MPRVFDNIDHELLPALRHSLETAERSDFCVGYFNLRGWQQLDDLIEEWSGEDNQCCRLLVGMQRTDREQTRAFFEKDQEGQRIDNSTAIRYRREIVQDFREQLTLGKPTNHDERGLR